MLICLIKPLFPVLFSGIIGIILSFVTPIGWMFPIIVIPGYWCTLFSKEKKICEIENEDILSVKKLFGIRNLKSYFVASRSSFCNGFGKNKAIYISALHNKKDAVTAYAHECGHVYYNHPLLNAIFFSTISIFVSFTIIPKLQYVSLVLLLLSIPLTVWKTIWMEFEADRKADTRSDMADYLVRNVPDSFVRKARLSVLRG